MSQAQTTTYEFTFDSEQTCKTTWRIEVVSRVDGPVIRDVQVQAGLTPNGKEMGCKGHPRTIAALVRGQRVDAIDVQALVETACTRPCSCGQALAECLQQIRSRNSSS